MNPRIPHHKVVMVPHASIISEISITVLCLCYPVTELFKKFICNHLYHYEKHDGATRPSYDLKLKYPLPFSVSYV